MMLLPEKDQAAFKDWLLPKLENISDAEAGVLADYVAALVTVDETEANVRRSCIESLEDFLGKDNTEPFVNDVISALKDRTYLPKAKTPTPIQAPHSAPIQSIVGSTNLEYEPHPSNAPPDAPKGPAAGRFPNASHRLPDRPTAQYTQQDVLNQSRKRKGVEGDDGHGSGSSRPSKQAARRNGRNARAGDMQQQNASYDLNRMPNFANLPPLPPGPLPFDPSDPTAFFAMAAAAFGANFPGMPPLPLPDARGNKGPKKPCTDYHEKGFCAMGNFCPFEHSDAAVVVPAHEVPEYDPEKSFLAVQPHRNTRKQASLHGQRRTTKPGRSRAPFSQLGPSYDPSNTTLVVEHIPPENLNEDSIRSYFSEFGSILEVDIQTNRRLAIIKFADHSAANRAYSSPKAVFENRFVKVYWYFEEDHPEQEEEEKLDLEAIAIKQAEAQRAFEERRRKEEEAAARAAEIDRQLKEKNEEMQEIRRQLAELSGDKADEFSQTLETLQAEAAELFGQHDPSESSMRGRGRGAFRAAYRGRGFSPFPPRGRGFTPYRGAYRGRESGFFPGRSAVKRLDNRPRRLAVTGIEPDTPRDEALRQYLLNIPDCMSIERHPEQADALILTFKERYQAEMFLDQSLKIPDVGKLDLSWVPNDAFGGLRPSTTTTEDAPTGVEEEDSPDTIGETDVKVEEEEGQPFGGADADMDVADDVDQWL